MIKDINKQAREWLADCNRFKLGIGRPCRIAAYACLGVLLICAHVSAQDDGAVVSIQAVADQSNQGFDETEQQLRELDEANSSQPGPAIDEQRVKLINDRIELLKKMIAEEKKQGALPEMPKVPKRKQPESSNRQGGKSDSEGAGGKPDGDQPKVVETHKIQAPTVAIGESILSAPVNSMELSQSLYMTGNYAAAIKNLQGLLKTNLSAHDEVWVRCLIGNCYRQRGQFGLAEAAYRDSIEAKDEIEFPYSKVYSAWCVSHMESRKKAIDRVRLVAEELAVIEEEFKK